VEIPFAREKRTPVEQVDARPLRFRDEDDTVIQRYRTGSVRRCRPNEMDRRNRTDEPIFYSDDTRTCRR